MIIVKKLNGIEIAINAELIETVESTPDTVINLVTGNRFVVRDSLSDVINKITEYKKKVYSEKAIINPIEGYEKK
jgi:flagellar protein FlbD